MDPQVFLPPPSMNAYDQHFDVIDIMISVKDLYHIYQLLYGLEP